MKMHLPQRSWAMCTFCRCFLASSVKSYSPPHYCSADEAFKGAAYLTSYIKDEPKSVDTPWNLATGRKGTIWQWFKEPDNVWRYHRFTAAMKGGADRFPSSIYTESIDWKSLTPNSVVVDVGGSVGKVTYELYKTFPHLKYVIQDLPPVVKDARNVRGF
jgi:hypothetical protein